jgi:hypothetical protein
MQVKYRKENKMTKNKTQDSQEQETVIDQTLVEKIDNVINEQIKVENSETTLDLIKYLSENVYPQFKDKDADKEIKTVRKYILASYPYYDELGITRNAYDVMNSRISRGGQLVFRKKLTITDNRLRDKNGNAITISKMEDIHNSFINKTKPKIEIVEDKVVVEDTNDIELPLTVEESPRRVSDLSSSDMINELSDTDLFVDVSTTFFTRMMTLSSSDLDNLLTDRNFVEYVKENYKPLKHLLEQIIEIGAKKKSKVA